MAAINGGRREEQLARHITKSRQVAAKPTVSILRGRGYTGCAANAGAAQHGTGDLFAFVEGAQTKHQG